MGVALVERSEHDIDGENGAKEQQELSRARFARLACFASELRLEIVGNCEQRRVHELDSSREIVAHCKMGGRSAKAVAFLRQSGFSKVHNLAGGITAWAERVDPKMPKY